MEKHSIAYIHKTYLPEYDRWHGKLRPRIISWFAHIGEVVQLYAQGTKPYYKHGRSTGTCREHAKTEFKDWLWLTAEITWMIFHIQLPIVPSTTYDRVISKMEDNKKSAQ